MESLKHKTRQDQLPHISPTTNTNSRVTLRKMDSDNRFKPTQKHNPKNKQLSN